MNSLAVRLAAASALSIVSVSADWSNYQPSEECRSFYNEPSRPSNNWQPLPVKQSVSAYYMGKMPESFDARTRWPKCTSIGEIHDQGCCSASYAIAPTSVMTDRTCIRSNGTERTVYSAYDPLVCCPDCALYSVDKCRAGEPIAVWNYWRNVGIVSGGTFMTREGCLPYPFQTSCLGQSCPKLCIAGYQATVASDKNYGVSVYSVTPNTLDIQAEIYTNGPVETTIHMYLDFANFDGIGVYQHKSGPYVGEQSVKLIGWGVKPDGTDYWLAVNSFGVGWGNKGYFRFLRGHNHMGIEDNVRAGLPNV